MPGRTACGCVIGLYTLAAPALADPVDFSLTYLDRTGIDDGGLAEPSGLALARDGRSLWTVDDSRSAGGNKVFELDLDGDLRRSLAIEASDLEGIALDASGAGLLAVEEKTSTILQIDIEAEKVVGRHPLSAMAGFDQIAGDFGPDDDGKALEAITVDPRSGNVLVLKEGEPGLLIEISADLASIVAVRPLGAANGFVDDDTDTEEIDFSGITFDAHRRAFWIVSDEARRLYLYDRDSDQVIQSATLGYQRDDAYREIDKAEGVAVDPETGRLYVVSDEEARLYVFDLR